MTRSSLNPKQSDDAGRYRLSALALVSGVVGLVLGSASSSEVLATVLVSGGIGLLIGGALAAWSAWQSKELARQARES